MGEAIEVEADGRPVRVSNPDKVYFPALGADGGTKLDLVRHYLSVGPGIVAALRNRPTYLQRFP
jgi:DNA primase